MEHEEHEEFVEDSGVVTEVNGNKVKVVVQRGGGCKNCQMRGFCFSKNTPSMFELSTELVLQEGDRVQLEISPGGRAMASLLVFGLPLVFLFVGFIVTNHWLDEIMSIFAGFAAMAVGFLIVRLVDKKCAKKLNIHIVRKL